MTGSIFGNKGPASKVTQSPSIRGSTTSVVTPVANIVPEFGGVSGQGGSGVQGEHSYHAGGEGGSGAGNNVRPKITTSKY